MSSISAGLTYINAVITEVATQRAAAVSALAADSAELNGVLSVLDKIRDFARSFAG